MMLSHEIKQMARLGGAAQYRKQTGAEPAPRLQNSSRAPKNSFQDTVRSATGGSNSIGRKDAQKHNSNYSDSYEQTLRQFRSLDPKNQSNELAHTFRQLYNESYNETLKRGGKERSNSKSSKPQVQSQLGHHPQATLPLTHRNTQRNIVSQMSNTQRSMANDEQVLDLRKQKTPLKQVGSKGAANLDSYKKQFRNVKDMVFK